MHQGRGKDVEVLSKDREGLSNDAEELSNNRGGGIKQG